MIEQGGYKLFYRGDGQLDAVNDAATGATLWTISEPLPEWFGSEGIEVYRADMVAPSPPPLLNWAGLLAGLHDSDAWVRVWTALGEFNSGTVAATQKAVQVQRAYSLLVLTLSSTHRAETLQFAIAELRLALAATTGDFDAVELAFINGLLAECGFSLQLTPLTT